MSGELGELSLSLGELSLSLFAANSANCPCPFSLTPTYDASLNLRRIADAKGLVFNAVGTASFSSDRPSGWVRDEGFSLLSCGSSGAFANGVVCERSSEIIVLSRQYGKCKG